MKVKVIITAELKRLAGHPRIPRVGDVGQVLAVRRDKHVLVKFKGRAWPLSLKPDEFKYI